MSETNRKDESFRDHISTVDQKGKRLWIYPKAPKGKYFQWRKALSYVQLLVLLGLPFLKIQGHPALMLNVLERKFIFFGHIFWPEDGYLFGLFAITLVVFILLFTVALGRLFCGWLCPQTVFLEMVFRRIERWIEGDGPKQKKLDQSPMDRKKFFKKFLKHSIFYGLSFFIGNIFLAYFIGVDRLWQIITDPPTSHLWGLSTMIGFSLVFYGVFSRFREQACIMVCPYGRLQSVLQDQNTITISYDFERGEPRGKGKKNRAEEFGDCIDCGECVTVCPTGIDIRNGIQMECVNCTACMDSCDFVMEKVKKPKGLIRYASHNMITGEKKFRISPRVVAYGVVLCLLLTLDVFLWVRAPKVHTILTRLPGSLAVPMKNNQWANVYTLHMLNKTFENRTYTLKMLEPKGKLEISPKEIFIPGQSPYKTSLLIILPQPSLKRGNVTIKIGVFEDYRLIQTMETNFIGPEK